MKKFIFIILILVTSCTTNSSNVNIADELSFSEEMSIDKFILKLKSYSKNNSYPNIDY